MKVYLVDDSRSIRARIRVSVEEIGAEVIGEASTQEEAIRGLEQERPDLVVIDLRLKSGTGLNVLKYVKAKMPGVASIVLTNHAEEDFRDPCLKVGADYFLEKSRQYREFVSLIKKMNDCCSSQ